ncbi:MAG: hypothetical protein LAP13_00775 [Acidobacteriia bacterium]|nr:hypothetical protein [Terriglobia bacterium]
MTTFNRRRFIQAVGGTVGSVGSWAAPLPSVHLSLGKDTNALGDRSQAPSVDLQVDFSVRVDIRENLYDRWTVVSNPYGMHGENDGLPATPACSFNETTYYGQAFGTEPATGSFPGQALITGFEGRRLVNSKNRNLGTFIGELQSDLFEIKGERIDFLIGGGDFEGQTCINLFVESKPQDFQKVRTAAGDRNLKLVRKQWDVSAWKGRQAYLQILDYAPVERWGNHAAVSFPEDDYGFILLDDIRQTDAQGNRVSEGYDREHNFDFERVRTPQYQIQPARVAISLRAGEEQTRQFIVTQHGQKVGEFSLALRAAQVGSGLCKCDQQWRYRGEPLEGVKFETILRTPIAIQECEYYLHPGVLYNGNLTAERCHYLGEDFPEDTLTLPGGFSVEDKNWVVGGWVEPQPSGTEPKMSVRLQENHSTNRFEAVYLLPESTQFGRRLFLDADTRLTVENGLEVMKTLYYYSARKEIFPDTLSTRQGYGQVIRIGWSTLFPKSPTNPPHSLAEDYELRTKSMLDPRALMQEVVMGGRSYRVFFVGRWVLGKNFEFSEEYVPKPYFHNYAGFSWSGMAGLASYTAFKEYLRTSQSAARRVAEDTMDFFVDHGMSPLGILYSVYFEKGGFYGGGDPLSAGGGFGTYGQMENIDMCPLGESLYWYIKCYRLLKDAGIADKRKWVEAVQSSLDKIPDLYPDGDIPGRINGRTGRAGIRNIDVLYWSASPHTQYWNRPERVVYPKPSEGGPTTFTYLVWALVAFYQLSGQAKYLDYAKKIGDQILLVLARYGTFSGSEMDFFNIDKRGSHAAFAAMNYLYEVTHDPKWLEGAVQCANSFSTWQYAYNVNFDRYRNLPLGHFDYRTIGGTPVDIKFSTNNLVFDQGAEEFLKLWNVTGEKEWFERARALLHQGTESTLTETKRQWLNENYQGPGRGIIRAFNPNVGFDSHCLGGGTEDVLPAWPFKGNWTTKHAAILSMYMLAEALPVGEILQKYGSICYSFKWRYGGALDSLDNLQVLQRSNGIEIVARNMILKEQIYLLKLLDYPHQRAVVDGKVYSQGQIYSGIPIHFSSRETKHILIKEA